MVDNDTYPGMSENFCTSHPQYVILQLMCIGSFTLVIHVMLLISFVTTIALLKTVSKMISKRYL